MTAPDGRPWELLTFCEVNCEDEMDAFIEQRFPGHVIRSGSAMPETARCLTQSHVNDFALFVNDRPTWEKARAAKAT